jgi:16S rRNA (guanine527-N7)-methyltransferase
MRRLVEGAAALSVPLDDVQAEQFRRYSDELAAWNRRVNLTAVTDPHEVVAKHFLDSLSVAAALHDRAREPGLRLLDVGSGGGFPGIPLRIAFPQWRVALLEATGKKAAFLEHVVGLLRLDGASVIAGRAETIAHDPAHREAYDVVVSRAVAPMAVLAELCLPFCRTGGTFVAQKSAGADDEVSAARQAIETMGGGLDRLQEVSYDGGEGLLVVVEKAAPTPARYPRRSGIPAKRPL